MDMNKKIKMLRSKHKLTLEDVGNAVGVGKSTVRKWENGDIANMKRDKIAKLADALHCSPAYLMGWSDEIESSVDVNILPQEGLSDEHKELIELFDRLIDVDKQAALQNIRGLLAYREMEKKLNPSTTNKNNSDVG